MLNCELLRTFAAAASARTFGEAARARHVTVSAVSQQVKALETQLGVPLFDRLGRRVRLTGEGAALLAAVRPALGALDDALAAASDAHRGVGGRIAIGAPRAFAAVWLRPRLAALLRAHPALTAAIALDVPSRLERRLCDGELDLAILSRAPELPAIESRPVAEETFVAIAPPGGPRRAGADELRAQRWIVFDRDLAMHVPWWRAAFGRRAPLPQHVVCEVPSLDEMLGLVEAGVGFAVLPDYLVAPAVAARRVVAVAPVPASVRRATGTLYLAWRRGAVESARLRIVRAALLP